MVNQVGRYKPYLQKVPKPRDGMLTSDSAFNCGYGESVRHNKDQWRRVSKVNRSRMQCNPSWKTRRKRFGQEKITSLTMRFWPSSTPMGGGKTSYRDPDKQRQKGGVGCSDGRRECRFVVSTQAR